MCNHLKSRGWRQNVFQSRFDFSASQCIPVCGTTFRVMCVHHHHVLISAKLGQSLSVGIRMHALILNTSRHGLSLSPDSLLLVQDVACTQHARSNHLQPPRSIGTVRHAPSCLPTHTTCLSLRLRVVEDRAQSERGPTSTFLPLWHLSCRAPASGEATSRIPQVSQKSSLTATMRPACRFYPASPL